MKFFRIGFTLNPKLRGNGDYVKEYKLKIPTGKLYWEESKFIGSVYFQKIDFPPYLLDIELFAGSKINDLMIDGGPIPGKFVMSGKLKSILEKYRKTGFQFFKINILKKNEIYDDYWVLNMYEFNNEYVDFEKSIIKYEKHADDFEISYRTETQYLKIKSLKEFEYFITNKAKSGEVVSIEKLSLNENIITEDFFMIKYVSGGLYYVSEKLKKTIEDSGCIGIEFQPSELSYNEWIERDGPRDEIYGRSW